MQVEDGTLAVDTEDGELRADCVLAAMGRRPNVAGLGLESVGVAMDDKTGAIQVDEMSRSSVESVFAVGDVTSESQAARTWGSAEVDLDVAALGSQGSPMIGLSRRPHPADSRRHHGGQGVGQDALRRPADPRGPHLRALCGLLVPCCGELSVP